MYIDMSITQNRLPNIQVVSVVRSSVTYAWLITTVLDVRGILLISKPVVIILLAFLLLTWVCVL